MHRLLVLILSVALTAGCRQVSHNDDTLHTVSAVPDSFTVETLLPTTPVKSQGLSALCWLYAMLATIESDRLAMGDSVNLSPLWLVRHSLIEQAEMTYLTQRRVTMRGILPEAMRLIQTYGIVAWDSYHADPMPSARLARAVSETAMTLSAQQKGLATTRRSIEETLDREIGPAPHNVFMYRAEYTPLEFAHSVCLPGEWEAYTSFTHHPFGTQNIIEARDNTRMHTARNIRAEELLCLVVRSLADRHPVAWEGSMKLATAPDRRLDHTADSSAYFNAIQNERQRLLERHILTDDHCMAIVGIAYAPETHGKAQKRKRYFICKNSWGTDDGTDGFRFISEQQLLLSTILIMAKTGDS